MTWPFDPHATFGDNSTPKVTATHINEWEKNHNALSFHAYLQRPQMRVYSTDGANVVGYVSPMLIKDTATAKYRYVGAGALFITPSPCRGRCRRGCICTLPAPTALSAGKSRRLAPR